jgi:hypothetical protein
MVRFTSRPHRLPAQWAHNQPRRSRVPNMLPRVHHVVVCGILNAFDSLGGLRMHKSFRRLTDRKKKVSVHSAPIAAR